MFGMFRKIIVTVLSRSMQLIWHYQHRITRLHADFAGITHAISVLPNGMLCLQFFSLNPQQPTCRCCSSDGVSSFLSASRRRHVIMPGDSIQSGTGSAWHLDTRNQLLTSSIPQCLEYDIDID